MAAVDSIIVLVIGLSLIFGGFRGFVKEALSLTFWVLAIVLASMFNDQAASHFAGLVSNPAIRRVIAFVLIFIATVFAGGLISNGISRLTSAAGLGAPDRALGALFGIVRGIVIVTVVIMLSSQLDMTREWFSESRLVPYALVLADYFQGLLGLTGNGPAPA